MTSATGKKPTYRLKLHRGSVRTEKAPDDLNIQVGSVDLKASGGSQLNIVRDSELVPAFAVQVSSGQVSAIQGSSTQNIREGEVGSMDRGTLAISRLPFTPLQPPDRAVLNGSADGEPVTFQWQVAPSVAGRAQLIEIASTPEFASILRDQTIASTEPPMESV